MAQQTTNPGLSSTETASFGKVAIRLGFITPSQLEEAMKVQATAAKAGLRKRLGEILIKKGYLTPEQFQQVIKSQTVKNRRIGPYELLSKLGEGGMGSVFKARQVFMDRIIALKILAPKMAKNKAFQARFVREARAVAKLNHPNIVAGIDVGSADGYCYFAMEFVDGESLGQYMARKGGRLDEVRALEFCRQAALALHHAHQNNLLHRDVKPDNLLLDAEHRTVKLADLGLARSAESAEDDAALTLAGQAVGTPFYISPEQARGSSDLTPSTDVYSLGSSLFHMLTGQVPFDGPTAAVIMTRHLTDPVPHVCRLNPHISAGTEKIVMKCMQKLPEDRYTSAADLARDIAKLQAGAVDLDISFKHHGPREDLMATPEPAVPASTSGLIPPTRSFRRRRQSSDLIGLLIVLIVILGAAFGLYYLAQKDKTRPVSPPKRTEAESAPPPVVVQTLAVPAPIKPDADDGFVFSADLESEAPYFDADPLMAPLEAVRRIRDANPKVVNHVLRLARIRDKEGACAARILLPANLELSPRATVSFQVCFARAASVPELQIWWDYRVRDSQTRFLAKWTLRDPNFKNWTKVEVQVDNSQQRLMSQQLSGKPQFISFIAGKPDENVDVYIDNLVIRDEGDNAANDTREQPIAPPPSREAPVVPPPAGPSKGY